MKEVHLATKFALAIIIFRCLQLDVTTVKWLRDFKQTRKLEFEDKTLCALIFNNLNLQIVKFLKIFKEIFRTTIKKTFAKMFGIILLIFLIIQKKILCKPFIRCQKKQFKVKESRVLFEKICWQVYNFVTILSSKVNLRAPPVEACSPQD